MTKTFVVLFKQTMKIYTYSSLSAIFAEFTNEDLGVSLSSLQKRDLYADSYDNDLVHIELSITKSRGDIIRQKNRFL